MGFGMHHGITRRVNIGEFNNNESGGYDISISGFMFESVLHQLESWYMLFSSKVERESQLWIENNTKFTGTWYHIEMSRGERIEVGFTWDARFGTRFGSISIELWNGSECKSFSEVSEAAEHLQALIAKSVKSFYSPTVEFIVTSRPCGDMWNPAKYCITRRGESLCVSCNKAIEQEKGEDNEIRISGPDLRTDGESG